MTRRRSRGACAVVVVGVALAHVSGVSFERAAEAQEVSPAPSRRIVEVLVAGGGTDAAPLEDTVRELLSRLTLVMESQTVGHFDAEEASFRSTSRPSLLARVGVDLRVKDIAVVTVVDGRTGDVTLRRTVRRDGPPAVVREELAHVVQAAVDPMLLAEHDRAAAPPPPPPPPPPAPEPVAAPVPAPAPADAPPPRDIAQTSPESSRSPLALDLSTMAGAGSYAPGAGVVARAGGGAALVWRRGVRPSIGLAAHYVFPFETGPEEVALAHVGVASFRGTAALEVYGSTSFALDVAAGGGLDVLRVEPRSNVLPADRLGASTSRVDPVASAAVTGHLAIGAGTALSLMVAADVDLTSRRWVVDGDGQRSEAFAPSRVRPMAMLGFTFTALGDGRFAAHEAAR